MTDPWCQTCTHRETRYEQLYSRHSDWCRSPQVIAAHNRLARCIFERDGFDEKRTTPETRKCGPDHINYQWRDE